MVKNVPRDRAPEMKYHRLKPLKNHEVGGFTGVFLWRGRGGCPSPSRYTAGNTTQAAATQPQVCCKLRSSCRYQDAFASLVPDR